MDIRVKRRGIRMPSEKKLYTWAVAPGTVRRG